MRYAYPAYGYAADAPRHDALSRA